MSILIKGMEMPKSCLSCPLQGGTADCRLTQKTYNWGLPERPSDCPLVPVQKHGRLIDADALIAAHKQVCSRSMKFNLDLAPTIIPADHIGDGNEMVKPRKRDEAIQRLKDIGVLNEAGKVVEPYDKIFVPAEEGKT